MVMIGCQRVGDFDWELLKPSPRLLSGKLRNQEFEEAGMFVRSVSEGVPAGIE